MIKAQTFVMHTPNWKRFSRAVRRVATPRSLGVLVALDLACIALRGVTGNYYLVSDTRDGVALGCSLIGKSSAGIRCFKAGDYGLVEERHPILKGGGYVARVKCRKHKDAIRELFQKRKKPKPWKIEEPES